MSSWVPVGQFSPSAPEQEGQWLNVEDLRVEIDTTEVVGEVMAALEPPVNLVVLFENSLL